MLKSYHCEAVRIKWPNDILSENKKLCGILIENVFKGTTLKHSIVGIGLNVNQQHFEALPKASSIKCLTQTHQDLDTLLYAILLALEEFYNRLKAEEYDSLKREYLTFLFRKNKPSTFKNTEGQMFVGIIKGISEKGALQVLLEDDVLQTFTLKEISLLY